MALSVFAKDTGYALPHEPRFCKLSFIRPAIYQLELSRSQTNANEQVIIMYEMH